MLPVDLFPSSKQPAVRRPTFAVNLGDAALWRDGLVRLSVHRSLLPVVNTVSLWLAEPATIKAEGGGLLDALGVPDPFGGDAEPAPAYPVPGDAGSLSLGYDDENTPVFSGDVVSLRRNLHGLIRMDLCDGGAKLAATRVNLAYEQQAIGDIIKDLAGLAGAAVGAIPTGSMLPYAVFDNRRTVCDQVSDLAEAASWLCFIDADDTLQAIEPPSGSPVATFTYGLDLLALERQDRPEAARSTYAVGEGAAGTQGGDAWPWLVKDAGSIRAESAPGASHAASRGYLRSQEAVEAAVQGAANRAARNSKLIRLHTTGAAEVAPGAVIAVADAPDKDANGEWVVLDVRHRYDKLRGFTSRLLATGQAQAASSDGLGDLLGGLL